ncbi:MAG TPA: hypothetical protein VGJ03_12160 [Acidimicrobiales bacterium]
MRVVQFDIGDQRVEFHPYVTVLRGIDADLREQLVRALGALASGEAVAEGMVEAHGVFLDLSEDALALLDLPKPGIGGLDLVVRADQLPRALGPSALVQADLEHRRDLIAARVSAAEAEEERAGLALEASQEKLQDDGDGSSLDRPRAELERLTEVREQLETRFEAARLDHERAQQAQETAEELLIQARQQRSSAGRNANEATQALEAARVRRDPFATLAFDAARERLRALHTSQPDQPEADEASTTDAAVASTDEPESTDEADDADESTDELESTDEGDEVEQPDQAAADELAVSELTAEIDQLELEHAELEAALLALDTVDPFPVESALAYATSNDSVELVPSPDAQRVANEWLSNEASLAGEGSIEELSGNVLAAARRRLDAARSAVFEAERAVRVPEVDRLDIEALENAHEAVLVAQERADKRFGGERSRLRLAEVRAAEQAILDRVGFSTYASFMMGTSIQHVDTERENHLDAARAELAAAEDGLAELELGIDAELAHAALLARRRSLRDEATRILGRDPGDDLLWALRHHRVELRDDDDRTRRLRGALQTAGVALGDEHPPRRMLIDLAEIWLEEQRQTSARREELAHQVADVEAAIDRTREKVRRLRDNPSDVASRRERELEQAQAALREAEARLQRQSLIETEVSQRKADLAAAIDAEQAAAVELFAAESTEADAARTEHEAAANEERLRLELAETFTAERDAADALAELSHLIESLDSADDRAAREASVRDAAAAASAATASAVTIREERAHVDRMLDNISGNDDAAVVASAAAVEELEWYLLSRLAGQRSLSYAGSLPFVLDDALRGVRGDGLNHLLGRLERMSSAVQVIILSEDIEVAAWADSIGADRAVTLYPGAR